ncbi:MAG: arylsulfatase, partial [Verrucomicrobiae bacterium]|nr:arylsulfatase [Verrucomicrobiae bacterium]
MRNCLKLFLLSLIFLASVIIGRSNDVAPNVVLIMTDDQGWGDLGSHGNEFLDTPNLDRLAAEGITFERFIVSPMCAPTRASLLTGRYNLRAGTSWVSHGKEILRLNEVTLGEVFSVGGYATGCFGKWHNGEYGRYHPNDRGFQEFFGFCRGAWENYFDPVLEHNRKPVQTQGYITDVLTDAVLAFIENNQNRPFFCYVPYNAPHHPYQVPERYLLKYAAKGLDEKTACVYGMVENIDDNVARILAKLRELDIQKQTLVIFLSDNGPTGVTRYNGGMRGKKATVDEGGVRVPGTFYWPGRFEAGRSIDQIVAHMDLFPTLVELCNLPSLNKLPLDGMSLMPLLNGTADSWPDRMIFTHQNRFGDTLMTPGGLRTQRYRLVNRDDRYELYDMIEDPEQKIDIANRLPDLKNRLAKSYENWYQEVTLLGVTPPPLPVGYPTDMTTALQAEDAQIKGKLKFRRQQGWAHDSVLNWSS